MASTNYVGIDPVTDAIDEDLLPMPIKGLLEKEKDGVVDVQTNDSITDTIAENTDVAIYSTGGTLDLSALPKNVVKSLNVLMFSTTDDVNLTLPKQFKGAVVLGGGDDVLNAGTSTKPIDIQSGAGDDTITTGSGHDTVKGGDGDDLITTGKGNDNVSGGTGNDTIDAGVGNDTIVAGAGDDSINAGAGKDSIVIVNNDGETIVDGGVGKDILDLRGAGEITGVHQHTPGEISFHFDNGSSVTVTNVETFIGDLDGDGAVDTVNLVGLSDYIITG